MRCLAVCQTELAIRMLDEILLPSFEVEFLVENKPLARRLHEGGMSVTAGDPRRTQSRERTHAARTKPIIAAVPVRWSAARIDNHSAGSDGPTAE